MDYAKATRIAELQRVAEKNEARARTQAEVWVRRQTELERIAKEGREKVKVIHNEKASSGNKNVERVEQEKKSKMEEGEKRVNEVQRRINDFVAQVRLERENKRRAADDRALKEAEAAKAKEKKEKEEKCAEEEARVEAEQEKERLVKAQI
eukprot:CAMPEP_0194270566 /NCGR_PEP_ID=MMETSP0169-20130528/4534_1 /TAXON_ID=218684 /ORGANISM="Corethron pennatum, Strain L29A3" /LENGTH=150 /DNA_ID=CAMNT_0039012661 /DNA_START=54 /DNA_END=503 /DNA_ORIENTATION=+